MANTKMLGNSADKSRVPIKSQEATNTIKRGEPVILSLNGTDDGLAVIRASTGTAAMSNSLLYGVNLYDLLPGKTGEAQVNGINLFAVITRATRAATSDSWTSSATIASRAAVLLGVDTLNNAFTLGASLASNFTPGVILAQSIASMAASATATSDTRTAITTGVRVFLRLM